ncbi:hypothetical protein Dimus_004229, partial [Dionaea muscipula]
AADFWGEAGAQPIAARNGGRSSDSPRQAAIEDGWTSTVAPWTATAASGGDRRAEQRWQARVSFDSGEIGV